MLLRLKTQSSVLFSLFTYLLYANNFQMYIADWFRPFFQILHLYIHLPTQYPHLEI